MGSMGLFPPQRIPILWLGEKACLFRPLQRLGHISLTVTALGGIKATIVDLAVGKRQRRVKRARGLGIELLRVGVAF